MSAPLRHARRWPWWLLGIAFTGAGAPVLRSLVVADDLDAFVTTQMAQRHIAGLSLAIEQDGKIVVARAYGVTDRGEPRRVDTTTLFQAGSISKSVSALGALRLVEQGKLSLDTDVNGTLRSWKVPPSAFTANAPVTLRALLSHTAGLTVHGFPGSDVDSLKPTLVQVLDGAPPANTPPIRTDAAPGQRYNYSGGGFTIMQQMVVDVTGQSFPAYMRAAVLAPLGMGRSSFEQPLPPALAANTAAGHYADGRRVHGRWHVYPEMAAAGLWTTASDLLRFAIGVQRAYAGDSSALISKATATQMLTEQKAGYALGVGVQGTGDALRFNHNGRDEGFDALLTATATTGQAYAIMINANDDSRFMGRVGAFIARKYGWPGASPYRAPDAAAITPQRLTQATGLFDVGGGGFLTLVARDGHLFTSVGGGVDEEFVPVGDDRFASAERDMRLALKRDASGSVVAVERTVPNGSRVLPRLGPLFRGAPASGALDPLAAARADSVLRALSRGGDAMRSLGAVTPGARSDLAGSAWPPVAGLRSVTCAGSSTVTGGEVVRHGSAVARLGYCRASTSSGDRLIVVYYTSDGLVTDVDVIDE